MKKMFAKLGMPSLLSLAFLLGGLFFGANSAQAQTLTAPAGTPPSIIKTTGTWKNVSEALNALNSEITYLDQTLATSTPGNGVQMKWKLTIYSQIAKDLEIGVEVPVAAHTNFHQYAPAASQDTDAKPAVPGMSTADWNNIYNDMLGVLQQ